MEVTQPESVEEEPRRRRRRSHRKSSKSLHRRRKRMKEIGFWLLVCLIGAAVVATIAVMSGDSSG